MQSRGSFPRAASPRSLPPPRGTAATCRSSATTPATATTGDVARRVGRLAALFRHAGFFPGERVLVVAGATVEAFVALVAVLRAGLEPALLAPGPGPVEIAAHARAAGAVALLGPSHYGALELGESYLSAAALAEQVRMIATLGPEPVDGGVDVSFARLDAMVDVVDPGEAPDRAEPPMIVTFHGPPTSPTAVAHRQATLLADALSLVEQAHINPSAPLLSTLPPTSLAGLVAGPCAALLGASRLVLHGPFDAARFLAACDGAPGYHLVVPAAAGALLQDGSLTAGCASVVLVSRFPKNDGFVLPTILACDRPIVDVYAFAEDTLLAQRGVDGEAQPPNRVTDKSQSGGLGARLNRARAEHRLYGEGT